MKITKTCTIDTVVKSSLPNNIQNLLDSAYKATLNAYAPYSEFRVGAAVLLSSGVVVTGNNQENAAFPSGLCAERVAILAAKANYPNEQIVGMAIAVNTKLELKQQFTPSCGACLQVMSDIEKRQSNPIKVYIQGPENHVFVAQDVKQFLPFDFEL